MIQIDMAMPKCCDECDIQTGGNYCPIARKPMDFEVCSYQRMPFCPLEEVPETNIGKWISVKKRLPEKTERYMCLCYDFVTKSYWHELLWHENNRWWKSLATLEYDYTKHVTCWMPLPEPPKEEI